MIYQNVATRFSSEMTQTPIYALYEYRVSLENTDVQLFVNDRPQSFKLYYFWILIISV